MRTRRKSPASFWFSSLLALAGAMLLFSPAWVAAQDADAQDESSEQTDQAESASGGKQPVGMADTNRWENVTGATLSNNGKWVASGRKSSWSNGSLTIQQVSGDEEYTYDTGGTSPSAQFSHNSQYAVFTIGPPETSGKVGGGGRGGNGGAAGAAQKTKVVLLNLASGEETEIEGATGASFNGEAGTWLALRMSGGGAPAGGGGRGRGGRGGNAGGAQSEEQPVRGRDLVLYEIATGQQMNLGNVAQNSFSKSGQTLAMVIDAANKAGNGIQLRDMSTGVTKQVESADANYRSLTWTEEGDAFCVLKGVDHDDYEDQLNSVVAFRDLNAATPTKVIYDPQSDEDFPEGMTVSANAAPRWSEDLDVIVFGIEDAEMTEAAKKRAAEESPSDKQPEDEDADDEDADDEDDSDEDEDADEDGEDSDDEDDDGEDSDEKKPARPAPKETSANPAEVVIWHWQDPRMQSQQQVQEGRDRQESYACMYRVNDDKFIRLEDEEVESVSTSTLLRGARFLVGTDNTKYELVSNLDGLRYLDVYVIDTTTGKRRLALEQCQWFVGVSPEGDKALYFEDGHYHAYDLASGKSRNITENVPTNFWNDEDDHNQDRPPIRPQGWVKGGSCVLLSDNWDVWCVPVHGGDATNLTVNGKSDSIRYSRVGVDEEDDGIDLTRPQYFSTYGEWTKQSGYSLVDNGTPGATSLLWDDCAYGSLSKAEDADVFMFTRQTFQAYPQYLVADNPTLADAKMFATANEDNNGFAWSSGVKLLDYSSDKGDKLQAALYLPADYEEGKQYPTIVYIYEKLSQGLHRYSAPRAGGFSPSLYTSQGYAVLQPDIVYQVNDPGMSAVWCVLPALTAAVESGVVDADHVAIHGHSWGGYQTAFLITQTDRFAAAIAGAPLTNMISMYSSIYWNSGSANQPIFESSQGRFTSGYWDNMDAYARNSPVYYAQNVTTPLMLLHNDQDGAVDWNQGIEYFNTLRRLRKPVVMLQYVGENHGVARPDNRRDYGERMLEFFDHYLKGEEAPAWLAKGIPHLDLEDHLKDRTEVSNEDIAAAKQEHAKSAKDDADDDDADDDDAGDGADDDDSGDSD